MLSVSEEMKKKAVKDPEKSLNYLMTKAPSDNINTLKDLIEKYEYILNERSKLIDKIGEYISANINKPKERYLEGLNRNLAEKMSSYFFSLFKEEFDEVYNNVSNKKPTKTFQFLKSKIEKFRIQESDFFNNIVAEFENKFDDFAAFQQSEPVKS